MTNETTAPVQSLHDQIMRLPCTPPKDANVNQMLAYKSGHRDARHAAAELAAAHEAEQAAPVAVPPAQPTQADMNAAIDRMRRENNLSIDGDNAYKRDLLDCVIGALAFGKQGSAPPPEDHWLHQFWEIGDAERKERDEAMQAAPVAVPGAYRDDSRVPDDYQNAAAGYRAGWNDCRAAMLAAPDDTAPPAPGQSDRMEDLAALVRKLVRALRKAAPEHDLPQKALDYLQRSGLAGSPLRTEQAEQSHPVNRSVIRDVFLRNGFTIKEGHSDLKPYVYAAAEELLALDGKEVAAEQDAVTVPRNRIEKLREELWRFDNLPSFSRGTTAEADAPYHALEAARALLGGGV